MMVHSRHVYNSVPLIVRGPDIAKNETSDIVSAHHDLAPTFLALAKGDEHVPAWVDGGVIPWTSSLQNHPRPASEETFAVEFWFEQLFNEYALTGFSFLGLLTGWDIDTSLN